MIHALLFAGGTGRRMQSGGTPKQFLSVFGKPIIVYTVEHFEYHPEIDDICIVCLEAFIPKLRHLLESYGIKKVLDVIPGGETSQASIWNGLSYLNDKFKSREDIVLIHDGVRPLIDDTLISQNIASVKQNGNAITVVRATETFCTVTNNQIDTVLPRQNCVIARAPQSFFLNDIVNAHKWAQINHVTDTIDSCDLTKRYGKPLYFVESSSTNIKITYPIDFYFFKSILDARESEQVIGLT